MHIFIWRLMNKDDLKSLVTQMCQELQNNIDSQKDAKKEHIINYLNDAVKSMKQIHEDEITSQEHAKLVFQNAYKEVTDKAIASYKSTNNRFEELAQIQEETLQNYEHQLIDMPLIKEKFNNIQNHMTKEVARANEIIIQLLAQVEELENRSNLDSLTKIFNRRALDTYLETICDKQELKHELHVLMLDIDNFKQINDKYGHIAGDKILIFIANILRKTLRDGDRIFRYGGEEFIIILNRVDMITCKSITERILQLIRSNQLFYKNQSIHVTVSIGATKYYPGDTPDAIINRADKALYRSKSNGKNQMQVELQDGV